MEVTVWCNGQAPRPENIGGLGILDSKRFGMALRLITWFGMSEMTPKDYWWKLLCPTIKRIKLFFLPQWWCLLDEDTKRVSSTRHG
jgi:hypothetical protein